MFMASLPAALAPLSREAAAIQAETAMARRQQIVWPLF